MPKKFAKDMIEYLVSKENIKEPLLIRNWFNGHGYKIDPRTIKKYLKEII